MALVMRATEHHDDMIILKQDVALRPYLTAEPALRMLMRVLGPALHAGEPLII
jgi:hypothetical protein